MRYENEPCTACGQALRPETDDIVVCPECGAPLHRHCWQEAGACPYAARHGEGFAWVPTVAPPEPDPPAREGRPGIICPGCGENCPPDAPHCENCGTDFEEFGTAMRLRFEQEQLRREQYMRENFPVYTVNGRSVTMGDTLAGQPVEEIALQLRGPRRAVSRYLDRFEKNTRVGWNWAAFLLGPYWFFFRKLYKPALLLAAAFIAMTLAFAPMSGTVRQRSRQLMDQVQAAKTDEAAQAAVISYSQDMNRYYHNYRWQIFACMGIFLVLRAASALLADPLLRRRIWRNIEYVREEGVTADGPGQRFGRHQLLIRLGGFSLVAPVLYFWASYLLPGLIVDVVTWITR
ncbi:MAG: DUF2628 domain-containing protein [Oscillospiraceae bacterium]|nr:DUF2628 domain-containing protein [Oscillospiraceae bacterium]